ncbi:MAG TPA: hypothetical protein VF183_12320 [Acidimicrobiales bacterium]
MAIDRQESPYRRGNRYDVLPIPMVREHCIPIDAGAVQLVVESRRLTNQILEETYPDGTLPVYDVDFDDHGPSLHVCGTDDGLEHLRFDCFELEPHYHYIEQANGANVIVRIDEVAVGDPIEFSLSCVEHRLPEMLANAGAVALADEVRSRMDHVRAALPKVRELMERARPVAA